MDTIAALKKQVADLQRQVDQLTDEKALLNKAIAQYMRQIKEGDPRGEIKRLRAKIAEWEGSSQYINGGYYHGNRFIKPFLDDEETAI